MHKQNSLFQYFTDNFDYLIEKDKKEGKYDMGILGKLARLRSGDEGKPEHSWVAGVYFSVRVPPAVL